ncbi:hypothetical protein F4556_001284 [Kitasatospora gansuensis]|uniref:Uncharacterized protein n=1 Tax=Kitasatospora gansuensis TaxID=258050 RepID=A0A7W7WGS3_9ACTN|nr:hypothetical protein [Kitasatospora gansuensis]MBB4945749.1 hypothetical protein [Kitasatospora gansuensis]
MPVTDSSLRDEYAAAVERVAGRALDALTGGGRAVALTDPTSTAELAALRVLGPDLFAAQLLTGAPLESVTTASLAAALLAFPPDPAEPVGQDALVVAWLDHVSGFLAGRAAPQPAQPPDPEHWQRWSVRMAQLAPLALPGLDGPVHRAVRHRPLALARGATRAMLRRDHRTALRLTRWLAWLGTPVPLELPPLLDRLRLVGDGSRRTELELAITGLLLTEGLR